MSESKQKGKDRKKREKAEKKRKRGKEGKHVRENQGEHLGKQEKGGKTLKYRVEYMLPHFLSLICLFFGFHTEVATVAGSTETPV